MLIKLIADVAFGAKNLKKISKAKELHQRAVKKYNNAKKKYERQITIVQREMERIENLRGDIGLSFTDFSNVFEKIKNRPQFSQYSKDLGYINDLDLEDMHANYYYKEYLTQIAASHFFGPLSGFLLSDWSDDLVDDAEDFAEEVNEELEKIDKGIEFLTTLSDVTTRYENSLINVKTQYNLHLSQLKSIVEVQQKTNYLTYNSAEKKLLENTILLVGLLHEMCKLQLVKKNASSSQDINKQEVDNQIQKADTVLNKIQNN